jgi:hypothetical protein
MFPESKDELIDTPSLAFLCALLGAALVSHLQQQVTYLASASAAQNAGAAQL